MSADSASLRRPRVYATRGLPGGVLERLAGSARLEVWPGPGPVTPEALRAGIRRAEGLLCLLTDRIGRDLLASARELRVLSSYSVGLDHVDLEAATELGIPVGHTPGVLTETTADLAFGLLLAAARRLPEADRFVREGGWTPERAWEPDLLLGCDVHGATLGIVGLGAIGQALACRARGFDMELLGWTPSGRSVPGIGAVELPELLARSDFVSIHLALTEQTRGRIGPAELAYLRPGAVLVNTSRGGIVDEDALAARLRAGQLRAAALDVFAVEPLPTESPLRSAPGLVLAPHIGSASDATRIRMGELAVENLLAGLQGRPMPHCANPEVQRATRSPR